MSSNTQKPFIPTLFSKFAHYPKDLMKKKFDYEHSLKVLSRTSRSGLKFESAAVSSDVGDLRGYVKINFPRQSFGTPALELYNDGKTPSKVSIDLDNLPTGLSIVPTVSGDLNTKSLPLAGLEVTYKQEYVAAHANLKSDLEKHSLDASATFGQSFSAGSGFSVGGNVSLDVTNGADVKDYNIGAEFEQRDATFTYVTENNLSTYSASYFQRLTPDHILGAVFKRAFSGGNPLLTVGTEYRYSPDTTLKAKIEVPTGVINTHVEMRLTNPNILVGIASSYTLGKLSSDKVGVAVSFGDF